MPRYHIYLKGLDQNSVITVEADQMPNLATAEPWLVIGKSSFRLSEVVAVVAHEDIEHYE